MSRYEKGPRKRLVTLTVASARAPAHGGASVMSDGKVIGTITSGAWGHRVGKNLALAFVTPDMSAIGTAMTLDLCGEMVSAEVIAPSPYDPDHTIPRS